MHEWRIIIFAFVGQWEEKALTHGFAFLTGGLGYLLSCFALLGNHIMPITLF